MTIRVLIMGLPNAGKTTLARRLVAALGPDSTAWFNADAVRAQFNDWDFSPEGRLRQAVRMRHLADSCEKPIAVCDFVAPLPSLRQAFDAHCLVWVDAIKQGRFADTNALFEPPASVTVHVTDWDLDLWVPRIEQAIAQALAQSAPAAVRASV